MKTGGAMTGEELEEFASMVRKCWLRWCYNCDPDDIQQDAALFTLERSQEMDFGLRGHRSYYYTVAMREVRLRWNLGRHPLAITEHAIRTNAVSFGEEDRVPLLDCGDGAREDDRHGWTMPIELVDERTPDLKRERDDVERVRERLWEILADHVAEMKPADRQTLSMLLGIGGPQLDPSEVAEKTGRAPAAIWATVRRLAKSVRADRGARRARRVLVQSMEIQR